MYPGDLQELALFCLNYVISLHTMGTLAWTRGDNDGHNQLITIGLMTKYWIVKPKMRIYINRAQYFMPASLGSLFNLNGFKARR